MAEPQLDAGLFNSHTLTIRKKQGHGHDGFGRVHFSIIIIVNLISSSLQVLNQRECLPRLFPKRVPYTKLSQRFVALNYSRKPQGMWLALDKCLDQFFLKRGSLICAGQNSTLNMLKGVL